MGSPQIDGNERRQHDRESADSAFIRRGAADSREPRGRAEAREKRQRCINEEESTHGKPEELHSGKPFPEKLENRRLRPQRKAKGSAAGGRQPSHHWTTPVYEQGKTGQKQRKQPDVRVVLPRQRRIR